MHNFFDKFESFSIPNFPDKESSVYIILCTKNKEEKPIYVGETSRLRRRIGDYIVASFQAATDFRVGQAIRYLQEEGYEVVIEHKSVKEEHRKEEEKRIISNLLREGYLLLNDLEGYDYKSANEEQERQKIKSFCNNIMRRGV